MTVMQTTLHSQNNNYRPNWITGIYLIVCMYLKILHVSVSAYLLLLIPCKVAAILWGIVIHTVRGKTFLDLTSVTASHAVMYLKHAYTKTFMKWQNV